MPKSTRSRSGTDIGEIRASIYALCLASGVLKTVIQHITTAQNHAEFSQSLNSALQLQGLALLGTAIYQTIHGQLTLFHAICVLHLLSLLGFGLVAQRNYQGGGGFYRWAVLGALRVVVGLAFVALTAYIWLTAPTFGSQPECNVSTVYVVFGVSLHAVEAVFRYVILALMATVAVGWAVNMFVWALIAKCCCCGVGSVRSGLRQTQKSSRDLEALQRVLGRVRVSDPRFQRDMVSSQVVWLLVHTGVNVYMIVTLEQTVGRNQLSPEEREWTFGQVLAVFVLLGVVVEVINILLPKLDGDAVLNSAQDEGMVLQERVGGGSHRLLGDGPSATNTA